MAKSRNNDQTDKYTTTNMPVPLLLATVHYLKQCYFEEKSKMLETYSLYKGNGRLLKDWASWKNFEGKRQSSETFIVIGI